MFETTIYKVDTHAINNYHKGRKLNETHVIYILFHYLVSTQIVFTSPDLVHGAPHDGQAKQQGEMQVHC